MNNESPFRMYGHDQTRAFSFIADTVEGSETSHVIAKFGNDFDIEMPITQMVSKVIKQEISSAQAMEHLLARPLREDES